MSNSIYSCKHCQNLINSKFAKIFCSHTCSAKFNNDKRAPRTVESKLKTSRNVKAQYRANPSIRIRRLANKPPKTDVKLFTCNYCTTEFYAPKHSSRKTCKRDTCVNHGSKFRNSNPSYNHVDGYVVHMDSSWEVSLATRLDDRSIKWIRPKPLTWNDNGTNRKYYPDFYLIDYDIYLDPKNDYVVSLTIEKLLQISTQVTLIHGKVPFIIDMLVEGLDIKLTP